MFWTPYLDVWLSSPHLNWMDILQLANYLRDQGVKKGDAVAIYMPMLAELPIAMLACARIGAVHSVSPSCLCEPCRRCPTVPHFPFNEDSFEKFCLELYRLTTSIAKFWTGIPVQVVFGGFSAESLSQRILDCKPKIVLTSSGVRRASKVINLKEIVDDALRRVSNEGFTVGKNLQ